LLAIAALANADCGGAGNTCIEVYNRCPFPVWPGITGSTLIEGGGFYLAAGGFKNLVVPMGWTNGRIWARRDCDGNFNCESGSCGNKLQCEGRSGQSPFSVAKFSLSSANFSQDVYDVSMVDGYNLPILID
ncbi:hypothetical protein PFISCL1PPCAC_26475, partial [Pristionchus fissidentatus]